MTKLKNLANAHYALGEVACDASSNHDINKKIIPKHFNLSFKSLLGNKFEIKTKIL